MIAHRAFVAAALAAAVVSPSLAAEPPQVLLASAPAVSQALDTKLAKLVGTGKGQTPALSVAIVQNGNVVYERGFGTAQTDTRFRIASITKMFTAVSIMQLVETNRVSLDAKVAEYLPDASHANDITIRQLLQHTSGLWNYGDAAFLSGAVRAPTTPAAILALAATHPLTSPPGTKFTYSNTGYVALGLIVERVTGQSLAAYEQVHILDRAAMSETLLAPPSATVPMATGYMTADGPAASAFDQTWLFADGDIISTAGDLARFDIALSSGRLVSPQTFALMQRDPVNAAQLGTYGLGLDIISSGGLRFVGHHGGVPGFVAENEMLPSQDVAMVVLSNAFDFPTRSANNVILTTLMPSLMPSKTVAATKTVEDVAITRRFRAALAGLLLGEIDRSQYTQTVDAALTPELLAQTASALKPLGEIKNLHYVGSEPGDSETTYIYDVTFSSGQTMRWNFGLTTQGKIAAIGSAG